MRRLRLVPSFRWLVGLVVCLALGAGNVRADDALLIGNSFTRGLFKTINAIAKAKNKDLAAQELAVGGKTWSYHLGASATTKMLAEKQWKWVVLQDSSVEPTHVGDVKKFRADGEKFYHRVRETSPDAIVVLYETWALAPGNAIFGESSPAKFADPAEMTAELVRNYAELAKKLEDLEPGKQVALAPVGAAFARSLELNPNIALHGPDKKHPSTEGHYLAALVIYATLTGDTPVGPEVTPGIKVSKEVAAKLQKVAEEVVTAQRAGK